MKFKRTLTGILAGGLICLSGCDTVKGTYEGYSIELTQVAGETTLTLYDNGKNPGNITFAEITRDGRIDTIDLRSLKKGSPLEKYATLETGQKIYDKLAPELLQNTGENTK